MSKNTNSLIIEIVVVGIIAVVAYYVIGAVWFSQPAQNSTTNSVANNTNAVVVNTVVNTTNTNASSEPDYVFLVDTTQISSGEITTYSFSTGNIVNIMPLSDKSMILAETPIQSQKDVTIGDVTAQYLTISSAKDGSDVHVVQAVIGDTLYDFRGTDSFLNSLDNYIQFNIK